MKQNGEGGQYEKRKVCGLKKGKVPYEKDIMYRKYAARDDSFMSIK